MIIGTDILDKYRSQLDGHPVYDAVQTLEDLQIFMQHHVFSVWDFMSLIKFLQSHIAPATFPWVPRGSADVRRFINELVLEEESDSTHEEGQFSSHFELYQRAMTEVGADPSVIQRFIAALDDLGMENALQSPDLPGASVEFTRVTFSYIDSVRPHEVAALLALGREHIIPSIFRAILSKIGIGPEEAPIFHFYLNRHIHLDEDFHAPLSLKMLNSFVADDETKAEEALVAADMAVQARLQFWDGVNQAIRTGR